MRRTHRLATALISALTLATALSCRDPNEGARGDHTAGDSVDARAAVAAGSVGLALRLSEGREETTEGERPPLAEGEPLSDREVDAVLRGLPALPAVADDTREFSLRRRSPPPPRPGETTREAFPPPPGDEAPPAPESAALEVVRYAPSGEVPIAPHLSVTFDRPMVPLTSQRDALEGEPPLVIEPRPEGRFRWVGTKTLLFEPERAFPMASDFRVTVPARTRSVSGAELAEPLTFAFSTPPPGLVERYPEGEVVRHAPIVFLRFDQRVDAARVAERVVFRAGARDIAARLATSEEVASDENVRARVEAAERRGQAARVVALAPTSRLPGGAAIELRAGPEIPSLEGPKRSEGVARFSFRTFGAFEVVDQACGWGRECRPGAPLRLRLSNPIARDSITAASITSDPPIEGLRVRASGEWLEITGAVEGRTTYSVTLAPGLVDVFGQRLAAPVTRTFEVGPAAPRLTGPTGSTLADPGRDDPAYVFSTVNVPEVDVTIHRVSPGDWPAFVAFSNQNPRAPVAPPGERVAKRTIAIAGPSDALVETAIDLSPALDGKLGHAVVIVEPAGFDERHPPVLRAWVQSTELGLAAFVDGEEVLGWVTDLGTGRALEGVSLEIDGAEAATTDAGGLARIDLARRRAEGGTLLAKRGADTAFLPASAHGAQPFGGYAGLARGSRVVWHTFDDRRVYRPGETLHLKGWVRRVDFDEGGDVEPVDRAAKSVAWTLYGPRRNELGRGTARLSELGGFDEAIELPETPNLGSASIELRLAGVKGAVHQHSFRIEEFRRPEYEVTTSASPGPYTVQERASVTTEASYYAGGALRSAPVEWRVATTETRFTPPNRSDYTFGRSWPIWGRPILRGGPVGAREAAVHTFEATTDARGRHTLALDFLTADPPLPAHVVAEARVTDVNRRTWAGRSTLLVHPSDVYVGLRSTKRFVEQGEPIEVEVLVVDHDGEIVAGREAVVTARLLDDGSVGRAADESARCRVESGEGPSRCRFEAPVGGSYRIEAIVTDAEGRPNLTELTVWVSGAPRSPDRRLASEEVALVADAAEYAPGETAKVAVEAPFRPAEALVTTRRSGLLSAERVVLTEPITTLEIPITEAHHPSVIVQVDLVGSAPRVDARGESVEGAPRRPAFARGEVRLSVPPAARRLTVRAAPEEREVVPGGETELTIRVEDHQGAPVRDAEVAVVVVDEAVLALSDEPARDPLATFHPERPEGVIDLHGRASLELAATDAVEESAGMAGGGAPEAAKRMALGARQAEDGGAGSIFLREDFSALALFEGAVRTGASGEAKLRLKVPDNLTRYRVVAVAASGARRFGVGESSLTARMPLVVRPAAPRFANFGDDFELPVVVQNQTDAPHEVDVALMASNLSVREGRGRRVTVPAGDRVEVRFPVRTRTAGIARFQVAARASVGADAARGAFPVHSPVTTEAFATYGELDEGVDRQPVKVPEGILEAFGGLEITTSSTQLQALTDAVIYLARYPFEGSEQLASRVLAIASLRDVLEAFEAEGVPTREGLDEAVDEAIERLVALQNPDGGFASWARGRRSWPFVSVHVASALVRAEAEGYEVPEATIESALSYVAEVEKHLASGYPARVRHVIAAYALRVLHDAGRSVGAAAKALVARAGHEALGVEGVGLVLGVLASDEGARADVARAVRFLENRVSETAGAASFASHYDDGAHLLLASSRRADAIALEALIAADPDHDLAAKVARGLLAHRERGRWSSTQENVFVLRALHAYFRTYERDTPNFSARIWLGEGFAGSQRFRGRSTRSRLVEAPMRHLLEHPSGVTIAKDGPGRLYYRLGMRYAPADLSLDPADHGFAVERTYEAVDDPGDVVRMDDGSVEVRAGARVRVRVTMVAASRRHHVALVDALPAGFEALNPRLKVTETLPGSRDPVGAAPFFGFVSLGPWYEHQSMRDERVEAFASLLPAGAYEYVYFARATTPGRFVVPPAKAEEMYAPETFGRSATDRVVVRPVR